MTWVDSQDGGSVKPGDYEAIPTRMGVRLVQHGVVLSEVRATPGPTQSVADAIAAAIHVLCRGKRLALLGFAGGGLLAPLHAMGAEWTVRAVDLDASGYRLFRRVCRSWAGEIDFRQQEASAWLRRSRDRFDAILEDLSIPVGDDVRKPQATWSMLPPLILRRLAPGGVGVFNLLHPGRDSWEQGFRRILQPGFQARVVTFADFENRLLLTGRRMPEARRLSDRLRRCLDGIGSRLARGISVRHCAVRAAPVS